MHTFVSSTLLAFTLLLQPLLTTATGDFGPDTCLQGWVWREAFAGDHVCVTPAVRTQAATDNSLASSRVQPGGGAFGPDTCLQGFVWREASPTDHVCVPPATRTQAAADNAAAPSRRASLNVWLTHWFPQPVCNGDVCSVTSDGDIARFKINGDHFNLASVTVGIYRNSDNSAIWTQTLTASNHAGFAAGSFGVNANVIDCQFSPTSTFNAYVQVYDSVSTRRSAKISVKTGCVIL